MEPIDRVRKGRWDQFCERLLVGKVSPMLGAGAIPPKIIGTASTVAKEWADAIEYPGPDPTDLAEVAQYLSSGLGDPPAVGEHIHRVFEDKLTDVTGLSVTSELHPLRYLTEHQLEVYLTTNYDDMIERCLRLAEKRPQPLSCQWRTDTEVTEPEEPVTSKTPLVFHLHGRQEETDSMVVTKSDYLEFVSEMSRRDLLPDEVTQAMADHSLLFIGYGFQDSNFHLILRAMGPKRASIAVLRPPRGVAGEQLERWMMYFPRYLQTLTGCEFDVFWGDGIDFCAELKRRLEGER